jgi:hypothetical protein
MFKAVGIDQYNALYEDLLTLEYLDEEIIVRQILHIPNAAAFKYSVLNSYLAENQASNIIPEIKSLLSTDLSDERK